MAYDAYEELRQQHEKGAYSFFEDFKLALYTARDVNENTPVAAANGREWSISGTQPFLPSVIFVSLERVKVSTKYF